MENFIKFNNFFLNNRILEYIATNKTLVTYNYIGHSNSQRKDILCLEEPFGNNCPLKAVCDALNELNTFQNLNSENKIKYDINYVSGEGGITREFNNNYKEDNKYQKDKGIGCMGSALSIDKNGNGRNYDEYLDITQIFVYIFKIFSTLLYNNLPYLSNEDKDNIRNLTIMLQSNDNDIIKRNNLIRFILDHEENTNEKILNEVFNNILFPQLNRTRAYSNYYLKSHYNKFCIMFYDNQDAKLYIQPIIYINNKYKDINVNNYTNMNVYIEQYINNRYTILHNHDVIILQISFYGNRNDFNTFNTITYQPTENYRLKAVIYSYKDNNDTQNRLSGGHYVCARQQNNYSYRILVNRTPMFASFLFYEK